MSLSKYLTALTNTQSIEELWDMHTRKMTSYGFDRLLYGFTRFRSGKSLGDPEDYVILTNHDPAYSDVFMGKGLYHHAPMVRWVLENEGACSWNIVPQLADNGMLTDSEKKPHRCCPRAPAGRGGGALHRNALRYLGSPVLSTDRP